MVHIHMIGIGGTGLSAIARVLLESGYTVTGSDRAASPFTRDLSAAGLTIHIGHLADNVQGADLVIRSSAIPDDNVEVVRARQVGIPVLKRADFIGSLMETKLGIAIAGTHGKTTTTSMLAWVLTSLGQDPTFISGGTVVNLGVNARSGKGNAFVIEADEYDRMFLGLKPVIEVVTNVEHDHPDCYPTPVDFQKAFLDFVNLLPINGSLVACVEDSGARMLYQVAKTKNTNVFAYGIASATMDGEIQMDSYCKDLVAHENSGFSFQACISGQSVHLTLRVPGIHNVLNALAVLTVIQIMGLPLPSAAAALEEFLGAGRRFEICGKVNGITIIDDYAHHPTEIRATLSAARSMYPGHRLWAVWQPHTYSRTRTLFNDFLAAFDNADYVLVTEIYAAREKSQDFSSAQIVNAMTHPSARYSGSLENTINTLVSLLQPGDVVLVLSAGNADSVSKKVLTHLMEKTHGK